MTSVPEITSMIARIEDWKGEGPVLGRAEAARRIERRRIGPVIRSLQRVTDPLFRRVGLVLE